MSIRDNDEDYIRFVKSLNWKEAIIVIISLIVTGITLYFAMWLILLLGGVFIIACIIYGIYKFLTDTNNHK